MNRQERRRLAKTGDVNSSPERLAPGHRLHAQGNLVQAEAFYREALRATPDEPEALRLLGEVLLDQGRMAEAIALLQRLVALQPRHFMSHYTLATGYRLTSQIEAAQAGYQTALGLNPGFAPAHHGLGAALRASGQEGAAAASLRAAVRLMPDWALAWKDLGLVLAVLGELDGAAAALKRATALQPGFGEAQRHLAAIRRDAASPAELTALQAQAADPRLPAMEKIDLLFTLGRLADKAERFEAAFEHFSAANAQLRVAQASAGRGFDRARLTRDVDRIISAFTPAQFAARADWGEASEVPVFIVGMPRAGSSLFEQIAASHTQVFGAGEQRGIGEIAARLGWAPTPAWTPQSIREAAASYLVSLRRQAGGVLRIIDKMPDNIFQLGLIATLFPQARVIFCARDARDVALSCFFQHFSEPVGFDTNLGDCAYRIRELSQLTAHWRQALPLRSVVFSYEALAADPEGESRRMIGFLGLEWEAQCLDFHQTERVVRTASWAQVRQPLYQRSVGRWRHYAAQLAAIDWEIAGL
jgi:tetratricopeptide (TPR) repeat protein